MSVRQMSRSRRQASRPSRTNRSLLTVQSPPPVLCIFSFLLSGACPIGAYAAAIYPLSPTQLYLLVGASFAATLWCLVSIIRKRQAGQPAKKVRSYVIAGLITGFLTVAMGYAAEAIAARTSPQSMIDLGEVFPDDVPQFKDEDDRDPEDDPSVGDGGGSGGTVVDLNGRKGEPTRGTETPELPKTVESGGTIPTASPTVLTAGTRLQLLPTGRGQVRLRLEEKAGQFVTGLSKADFRLFSREEAQLKFEIVELPSQTIAVRANISMIVDESLALPTQQGPCVAAIDTALQASPYAGYKLSTTGASIRTLMDWTSAAKNIGADATRFRQSYGGNLQASLSLNVADLSKQPTKRILLLFLSSRSLQVPLSNDMQTRFARAEITTLVVTDDSRTAKRLAHQQSSVQFFSFSQLDELQQVVRKLTTRVEPPSYLISDIESHRGSALRLVVGSGDSALTASLGQSSGIASLK